MAEYGPGHDILQPLNAARLYATAISERADDEQETELARDLDRPFSGSAAAAVR